MPDRPTADGLGPRDRSYLTAHRLSLSKALLFCRYTLREVWRSKAILLLLIGLLGIYLLSSFFSSVLLAEGEQLLPMLYASITRLGNTLLVSLVVCAAVTQDFEQRLSHLFLSAPCTRASYYLGRSLAYAGLCVLVAGLSALPLLPHVTWPAAVAWALSHSLELWIVSGFALLCSCSLHQATLAFFGTLGLYALARLLGSVELLLANPLLDTSSGTAWLFAQTMDVIQFVVPSLDQYARSEWFIHPPTLWTDELITQSREILLLSLLYFSAGVFDLYRKEL